MLALMVRCAPDTTGIFPVRWNLARHSGHGVGWFYACWCGTAIAGSGTTLYGQRMIPCSVPRSFFSLDTKNNGGGAEQSMWGFYSAVAQLRPSMVVVWLHWLHRHCFLALITSHHTCRHETRRDATCCRKRVSLEQMHSGAEHRVDASSGCHRRSNPWRSTRARGQRARGRERALALSAASSL